MISKFENFLKSKYYLMGVSIFTFIVWLINIDSIGPQAHFDILELIGIVLFSLLISFILVFYEKTIYIFPLIIHSVVMISNQQLGMDTLNSLYILYLVLGLIIGSFIYHFIKFKVKINFGYLGIGLGLMALAYIFSITGYLFDQKPMEFSVVFISLLGVIYLTIYTFFISTNKDDFLPYIFKSLLFLSLVVLLQTFSMIIIFFIDNKHLGSFIDVLKFAIQNRWIYIKHGVEVRLNAGWGSGNNLAGVMAMSLPLYLYFIFKENEIFKKIINFLLLILIMIAVVLTTSRGAYLGLFAFVIIFIFTILKYSQIEYKRYKKQILISTGILVVLSIPLIIFGFEFLKSLLSTNSFLNGRETDWNDAIKYFLEYPIFGKSWYSDTWELNSFRSYHNTILHTLATMGLFGLGALIFHHYQIIKLFIKKWSFETLIVASILIITHVHGLVDNTYYAPMHAIILLICYVGVELSINNKKDDTELSL